LIMAYTYNVNPAPTTGATAWGQVPGQIGIPPSEYDQVASAYPGQAAQTSLLSSNIGSELAGSLSPQTIAALQQHAAQFGAASGMPGSQFSGNQGLASLGLNVEATQRQGGQDLLAAEKGIGSMQTPQDLAASIASANANLGAAPDPQKAAEAQMGQWMAKFNASAGAGRGGGGGARSAGPSGGTGAYDPYFNSLAAGGGGDYGVTSATPFNGGTYVQSNADFNDLFGDPNQATGSPLYYSGSNPNPSQTPPNNTYGADIYDPTGAMFGDTGYGG
jgi:hypothetical protein